MARLFRGAAGVGRFILALCKAGHVLSRRSYDTTRFFGRAPKSMVFLISIEASKHCEAIGREAFRRSTELSPKVTWPSWRSLGDVECFQRRCNTSLRLFHSFLGVWLPAGFRPGMNVCLRHSFLIVVLTIMCRFLDRYIPFVHAKLHCLKRVDAFIPAPTRKWRVAPLHS